MRIKEGSIILIFFILIILVMVRDEPVAIINSGERLTLSESSVDDSLLNFYISDDMGKSIAEKNEVERFEALYLSFEDLRMETSEQKKLEQKKLAEKEVITSITISLAGDFTLGTDLKYGYENSFVHEVTRQSNDYNYFIKYIAPIFVEDNLTLVNLESTFTTAEKNAVKKFTFKGDPDFVNILTLADVEAVNIANNHTLDFLEEGFQETLSTLEDAGVGYFGYEHKYITEINGVKVGVLGYEGWEFKDKLKKQISNDIKYLKENSDLIIVSYHWGNQNEVYPIQTQIDLAHYTIDQGADLVFGHHPHAIQGIEEYNGKKIVYSLGNFLYGGHRNPADKDTFIYQQTFYFDQDRELLTETDVQIIPFSISSVNWRNNYQPTPLTGKDKERFEERMETLSLPLN